MPKLAHEAYENIEHVTMWKILKTNEWKKKAFRRSHCVCVYAMQTIEDI